MVKLSWSLFVSASLLNVQLIESSLIFMCCFPSAFLGRQFIASLIKSNFKGFSDDFQELLLYISMWFVGFV
jgi:hypothetical protein